ncbi:MAG: NAD(P)/FAD-dependent oxidoreductase [Lachnospiraceae bacterium]|nr:NAD(P)/FAD-dependent oxidoreductase [Lachnospiraceae bacterium]
MAYEKIFQRGRIGALNLKNRVVMPAMGVSLAQQNGEANEHIIRYYEERAKGGVGLIITEICRVEPVYGTAIPNQLGAYEMGQIPHLERLAERVHKYGTKIFLQLQHPGRENKSSMIGGRQIVAPSAVMCKVTQEMPRALTTEEVQDLVKAFIRGAVFAKIAGFDGVELHAAHGYLLDEFLSPYTNKRTDRYGGSFENRIRILEEMITGIRFMCGPKFAISVRISADEFVEGGLKLEDGVKIARTLESFGIDVINVSSGIYESSTTIVEPASFAQGWKRHLGTAVKKAVSIPVIAANNIKDPDVAEELLETNVCDYVALGRAHLADPNWVKKTKEGRADEINKCIGCLYCFGSLSEGGHIKCAVNPRCGREVEYSDIVKNGNGRKVAVIGSGPAGMVAALTLSERGFAPVLFEKEDHLGGQLNVAEKPLLKEKLGAYKQSLINRVMKDSNIQVCLSTEATAEAVKAVNPVGVFIATGGTPIVPKIPGIDGANVMSAEDVLLGRKEAKGKVAVIGGGVTGLETAETLGDKGCQVTLVEMMKDVGTGLYKSVLVDMMMRYQKMGIQVKTCERLMSIGEKDVTLMNTVTSQMSKLEADTVVIALGVTPVNQLVDTFYNEFDNVFVLGDANRSGRIVDATFDANGLCSTFLADE